MTCLRLVADRTLPACLLDYPEIGLTRFPSGDAVEWNHIKLLSAVAGTHSGFQAEQEQDMSAKEVRPRWEARKMEPGELTTIPTLRLDHIHCTIYHSSTDLLVGCRRNSDPGLQLPAHERNKYCVRQQEVRQTSFEIFVGLTESMRPILIASIALSIIIMWLYLQCRFS